MFLKYFLTFLMPWTLLMCKERSTFSGNAYNENNQLLFKEEYILEKEGDKILSVLTRFISPQGTLLAEMSSTFSNNNHLPVVLFTKNDPLHSYGTRFLDQAIELFKTTASQVKKHKTLSIQDNMVAGHGFYFFILSKLDSLLAGKPQQLVFLQPNRLNFYTFNIKATPVTEKPSLVKVSLSIDSRLLKAFVPDIHLVMDRKTGALISYEGLSGFFTHDDGSLKKISVSYTEPVQAP